MKGDLRKQQIINVAGKLFASSGYNHVRVEDVIRKAKIGRGTFYIYFENKEQLFLSVLENFINEWRKAVLIENMAYTQKDIKNYFHDLISRSISFLYEHKELCKVYPRIGSGFYEKFESYVDAFEKHMLLYVIKELRKGIGLGLYRSDFDLELVANIIIAAHMRIASYYFVPKKSKSNPKLDVKTIADQVFDLIFRGLRS